MGKGETEEKTVMMEKEKHQVLSRVFVVLTNCDGRRAGSLTIHPADTDGLAEGEQQQRGAAADMMVEQLQQIHSSLPSR